MQGGLLCRCTANAGQTYMHSTCHARALDSRSKILNGESESRIITALPRGEGVIGGEGSESRDVARVAATPCDAVREELPKEAIEQEHVKRPHELSRAEFEEMLAKQKSEAKL